MSTGTTHPKMLVPVYTIPSAKPSLFLNQWVSTMLPILKYTPLVIWVRVEVRFISRIHVEMVGTDAYTEPLAEEELPVLRAFGREEHANDKQSG